MSGTAPDDLSSCEKCRSPVSVEASDSGAVRIRCTSCGHVKEIHETTKTGDTWTVTGPDGKSQSFESWDEVISSQRPTMRNPEQMAIRTKESERKLSASALLGETASTVPQKTLSLSSEDSEPNLMIPKPTSAMTSKAPPAGSKAPPPPPLRGASVVPPIISTKPAPVEEAEELDQSSLIPESNEAEDEEEAPLSLKDALPDDEPPPSSGAHELVSMSDVVVLADKGSMVPRAGVLKAMPPTPTKAGVAPPPTISVEEEEAAKSNTMPPASRSGTASGSTKSKEVAPEPPKRGWIWASLAIIGVTAVLYKVIVSQPTPNATDIAQPTATPSPTPSLAPTPSATESSQPPTVSSAPEVSPSATSTPSATVATNTNPTPPAQGTSAAAPKNPVVSANRSEEKPVKEPAGGGGGESMSDLLDRAGSAKRKGDYPGARDLYEKVLKQSPSNVEANGGLGDVARAQGDLAAAKSSYERALAASPTYGPAQLGLADTEWDMGNHAGAQRRYAEIVSRLGARAPERAKQRGGGSAPEQNE